MHVSRNLLRKTQFLLALILVLLISVSCRAFSMGGDDLKPPEGKFYFAGSDMNSSTVGRQYITGISSKKLGGKF